MQISVIIPTCNRAQPLVAALQSVQQQTHQAHEIIVVDDGSTDGTAAMLAEQFPEVQVVQQANQGVSAARNAGLVKAEGEWVALLDSDDTWLPNKLQAQCAAAKLNTEAQVLHTDEVWVRNGVRVNAMDKHRKPHGWIYPQCLPLCCVSPSSVLIHKSVFERYGNFDETLPACEDYDLWLRLFSHLPVYLVEEPLVIKTGGHSDQLSRKHWGMDRFRVQALDKILTAGELKHADRVLTLEMLEYKCGILLMGAAKHKNEALAKQCHVLLEQHGLQDHA